MFLNVKLSLRNGFVAVTPYQTDDTNVFAVLHFILTEDKVYYFMCFYVFISVIYESRSQT